ncbi:MAG: hypothetical protein A2902_00445 [Elusimicrobia bacterium RIFCSPLOWO2_01_FULL_64_13]|nr:MAG: hypothetical protein A2902_00445 [Elusimicrobia bacterium RIFCSPLOWO2_01_FULL_64_13]
MLDFSVLTPKIVFEFTLRWIHFLAGVTWIGFLYWFNLINVKFQKSLDAELKPKVNPSLILPTLWYFRWGAVVTVVSGILYYAHILAGEPVSGAGMPLLAWLVVVAVAYAVIFQLVRGQGALSKGPVLAAATAVVIAVMSAAVFAAYQRFGVGTNPSFAIGIGGGMGVIMLLNVWGIIWPAQKRLLGLVPLREGQDKAVLARRAFLASRMNTWLSLPMLFFMGASSHLPFISW